MWSQLTLKCAYFSQSHATPKTFPQWVVNKWLRQIKWLRAAAHVNDMKRKTILNKGLRQTLCLNTLLHTVKWNDQRSTETLKFTAYIGLRSIGYRHVLKWWNHPLNVLQNPTKVVFSFKIDHIDVSPISQFDDECWRWQVRWICSPTASPVQSTCLVSPTVRSSVHRRDVLQKRIWKRFRILVVK